MTKKNLTTSIAVKKEKKIPAIKNRYKIYLYFMIFYHILTIKNRHKIDHILTVKNCHKVYNLLMIKNRYKLYNILIIKNRQKIF